MKRGTTNHLVMPLCYERKNTKTCDLGGIQTHDLQNRNLTLYSLSYQAKASQK